MLSRWTLRINRHAVELVRQRPYRLLALTWAPQGAPMNMRRNLWFVRVRRIVGPLFFISASVGSLS